MSCRLALQARIPAPWPQTLLRWPAVGVPQAVVSARRYSSLVAHRALIVVVRPWSGLAVLVDPLSHPMTHRVEINRYGQAQCTPERPATLRQREAVRRGMQV